MKAIDINWVPIALSTVSAYNCIPEVKEKIDILVGSFGSNHQNTADWISSRLQFDKWKYMKTCVPFEE